jgi:hypothetical protein
MKRTQELMIVPVERTTVAERRGTTVALPVQDGIQDLLVAYPPHPGEESVDRVRLARIWARETAEFETEIVTEALRDLLTNNRRNPFRPSVQDIVERCRSVRRQWSDRARRYYLAESEDAPPAWCSRIMLEGLHDKLSELSLGALWELRTRRADWLFLSDSEYIGWRMAKSIGPRLSEWPTDLLAESAS